MSNKPYSQSMEDVTGISDEDAKKLGAITGIIANANKEGLTLLKIQLKIFSTYIEKRLEEL